jgi:hypothetical protein
MITRFVARFIALFVTLSVGSVGCGRLAEPETEGVVVPDEKGKHDGAASGAKDARDARDAKDASTEDDGASKPVVVAPACDPSTCPLRPSICIDDNTMRWYSGSCGDSGTCEYTAHDMTCDKAPIQPDCFQGGCRLVVLR